MRRRASYPEDPLKCSSTLEILSALIDFLERRPDVTDELIRTIEERVRHRAPANPVR